MIEEKKLFRKREEYAIYFVPHSRSETGIQLEFSIRFFLPTKQFSRDLKEATKARSRINFCEALTQPIEEMCSEETL